MKKIIYLTIAMMLLVGCSMVSTENIIEHKGSLILSLESELSRVIQPSIVMEITSYDIVATGPDSVTFSQLSITETNVTRNDLPIGDWSITVDAKNTEDTIIASVTETFTIVSGETTNLDITVLPVVGEGTLTLDLTWPENKIITPVIEASITDVNETSYPIIFTLTEDNISASFTDSTIATGYYTLTIKLLDDTTFIWGNVEAVRIIKNEISSSNIILIEDDFLLTESSQYGDFQLNVGNDLQNPFGIILTGNLEKLSTGGEHNIVSSADITPDSYKWYLNSEIITDESSSSITIGKTLPTGNYRLDLIASKGVVLSSSSTSFNVADSVLPINNIELVDITGGTYSQKNSYNSGFTHTVSDFSIGKYEVTYELWYEVRQWALTHEYIFTNEGREGKGGIIHDGYPPSNNKYHPVTLVNWRDSIVWCNAYSEMSGYKPVYLDSSSNIIKDSTDSNAIICDATVPDWTANGFRLPTEGEWQFSASNKGATPYNYASGSTADYTDLTASSDVAWFDESETSNVGEKIPNALGLYDMSGNVSEWCYDWYEPYIYYDNGYSLYIITATDYRGYSTSNQRIIRGGSIHTEHSPVTTFLQVGSRGSLNPDYESLYSGFRIARYK